MFKDSFGPLVNLMFMFMDCGRNPTARQAIVPANASWSGLKPSNLLLWFHHQATEFSTSLYKNTDHFRCFDEKQNAFWCQRSRATIRPSQLQTGGWYTIHVSSLLINDNDKFVLLSSPCCVRQTHNDSLSSFIIIYDSFKSHLHNKDHL